MAGAPVFLSHPSSLDHDPGPHPEQAARITAIERALAAGGGLEGLGYERRQSTAVERDVLESVHPHSYVEALARISAGGGGQLDLDTVMSPGSLAAALHGAGGAVALVDMLAGGEAATGFSAHRPPGHHALASRAMGFCLFNHVAVATRYALDARGLDRVMIFDWDVHHGNGTNDLFHRSDQVLFVSIHQSPLYPGTGSASDVGSGPGEGYTVNLPVPPGSGDGVYLSLVEQVVAPLARAFEPQLVLVSAGYDAHLEDPLADCTVSDDGFAGMARCLEAVCRELGVPLGAVLEGGYGLAALGRSVVATLAAMAGVGAADGSAGGPETEPACAARERLAPWWRM